MRRLNGLREMDAQTMAGLSATTVIDVVTSCDSARLERGTNNGNAVGEVRHNKEGEKRTAGCRGQTRPSIQAVEKSAALCASSRE